MLVALQFVDKETWYLIALGAWAVGLAIWYWIDRSMMRNAMEAISEDEDAAAAAGINVTAEKLKITVISAVMTAFAGALYCQYQMFISPDTVSGISVSLQMVFAAVVGRHLRRAWPDRRRHHHHPAGRRAAYRLRHSGGRLGQPDLRRPVGGVHHLSSQGHSRQLAGANEGPEQAIAMVDCHFRRALGCSPDDSPVVMPLKSSGPPERYFVMPVMLWLTARGSRMGQRPASTWAQNAASAALKASGSSMLMV